MRGPGRPRHAAEDTRLGIVEAAIEAFALHGYSGTNLRAVAATAGVTLGTLTHHFPSKSELFATAHARAAAVICEGYTEALEGAEGIQDELSRILERSARFLDERPALTQVLIRAVADTSHPDVRDEQLSRPLQDLLAAVAHRAVERGEVSAGDGAALLALLHSMLWGVSIVGVDRANARAASIRGFSLLFRGELLPPP